MTLYVALPADTHIPIDINIDTTVQDIINDIKQYIENPKIIYRGKELDNHKDTLADLGICPESLVYAEPSHRLMILFARTYDNEYGTDDYYIFDPITRNVHCIKMADGGIYCDSYPMVKDGNKYTLHPYDGITQDIILDDQRYYTITHNDDYEVERQCMILDNININIYREERDAITYINNICKMYPMLDIKYDKITH